MDYESKFDPVIQAALNLTSSLDLEQVLASILDELNRLIPYDVATVLLKEGDKLRVLGSRGFLAPCELVFSISKNPRLGRAICSNKAIRFSDPAEKDPFDGLIEDPDNALKKVHSCMASPLIFMGDIMGVLTVDSLKSDLFTRADEDTLMAFATFAALAIRNAQLMHEAKKSKALLVHQNRNLREEIEYRFGGAELIGESKAMMRLKQELEIVAPSNKSVLIQGETGSGKEIVARYIHHHSLCPQKPIIYVNCAAIPETLIESELFGHRKGAFTGALESRIGKFRSADGGTLFLDEVGDLPLNAQPRLLRVLQEGEVTPLGSDQTLRVNVRVIAATNKDLLHEVEKLRFRQDLYHRLAIFPITVAPLSERMEDIPLLVEHFLQKHSPGLGLQNIPLREEFLEALYQLRWPGNVRELEHFIERALIWSRRFTHPELNQVLIQQLFGENQNSFPRAQIQSSESDFSLASCMEVSSLKGATEKFQRSLIHKTLEENHGNQAKAARVLCVDRSNLNRKIKAFGL